MSLSDLERIGIVDYHLDNFHANTYLAALRGPLIKREFVFSGATAQISEPSESWATRNQLPYFRSVEELALHCDCFLVLAPSNPEVHEELCRQVLPYGKTTFVDKPFAPDTQTARRIFDLADKHGTPLQTTSALRTTNVQKLLKKTKATVRNLYVYASGKSFQEYGIHPVELAVSCLGSSVLELMRLGCDEHPLLVLRYPQDRFAVIDFTVGTDVPYSVHIVTDDSSQYVEVDFSNLFADALSDILDFFEAGASAIPRDETLTVMRILDAAFAPSIYNRFDPIQTAETLHVHSDFGTRPSELTAISEGVK